jgi:hypothetical protein
MPLRVSITATPVKPAVMLTASAQRLYEADVDGHRLYILDEAIRRNP